MSRCASARSRSAIGISGGVRRQRRQPPAIAQQVGPDLDHRARRLLAGVGGAGALELVQQRGVALDAGDGGDRVVDDRRPQPGDLGAQLARGQLAERHDADAGHAQRRQQLADVGGQRGAAGDDRQLARRELVGKGKRQVPEPVQADGGLAAAGAPLDDDHAGVARRDEVELARIDQRGDLGQVPVERLPSDGSGAQLSALGADGGLLSAGQLVRRQIGPRPFPVRAAGPDALRAGHAAQDAAFDGQDPARHDLPLDVAIAEALFVVAPLGVTIEELAHRRVPPVDDVHAGGGVDERRAPDEDVALDGAAPADLLAQPQVAEVRRGGIDQDRLQIAAGERHVLQPLHLRHQRRHVFQARLADLVAQRDHLLDVVAARRGARRRTRGRRMRRQAGQHAREQPLLLGGDVGGRHGLEATRRRICM